MMRRLVAWAFVWTLVMGAYLTGGIVLSLAVEDDLLVFALVFLLGVLLACAGLALTVRVVRNLDVSETPRP